MIEDAVSRARIAAVHPRIAPHIRRTPIVEIDGADIGLDPTRVLLKLEQLQHSGSFKARGAFVNLIMRQGSARRGRRGVGWQSWCRGRLRRDAAWRAREDQAVYHSPAFTSLRILRFMRSRFRALMWLI